MTTHTQEKPAQKVRLFDPYKVLLHNDDKNDVDYVITSLIKAVPQLSTPEAADMTLEAHKQGVSIVLSAPLEHAEMYCERIQSFGLTSSIEKDF